MSARPIPRVTSMWMDELARPRLYAAGYIATIVATVLISLLLGGCGGGDPDPNPDAYVRGAPAAGEQRTTQPPDCAASEVCR